MVETASKDVKFFVEKHQESLNKPRPEALKELLNDEVCDFLNSRKWGVSLATIDLSEKTAKVIQDINKNYPQLPFTMWLVLPDRQGYWTNESSIKETKSLVKNVENWVNQYKLNVAGFGFDIEPPIDFIRETNKSLPHLALNVIKRDFSLRTTHKFQKENFRQELDGLINNVRHNGIPTEAYVHPWITGKLFNIAPRTNADYDFVMVYSSLFKDPLGQAIPKYFLDKDNKKQFPAIGNFTHDIKKHDGRKLAPNDEKSITGLEELGRNIANLAQKSQKDGRNYLERFRVFALTGKPIIETTDRALEKIKATSSNF